jgi:hypothetical protein
VKSVRRRRARLSLACALTVMPISAALLAGWDFGTATNNLLEIYTEVFQKSQELVNRWAKKGKQMRTVSDLLKCYYSSTSVIRMPHKGRYGLLQTQILRLMKFEDEVRRIWRN